MEMRTLDNTVCLRVVTRNLNMVYMVLSLKVVSADTKGPPLLETNSVTAPQRHKRLAYIQSPIVLAVWVVEAQPSDHEVDAQRAWKKSLYNPGMSIVSTCTRIIGAVGHKTVGGIQIFVVSLI